jgi:RimJ/RimL family protein N-acetyltransferase
MSFDTQKISLEEHEAWLDESLNLSSRYLYIGVKDEQKIGVLRFDVDLEKHQGEVSINLNPDFRGRGLSAELLTEGINVFRGDQNMSLIAQIKKENVKSIELFERCGFSLVSSSDDRFIYGYDG